MRIITCSFFAVLFVMMGCSHVTETDPNYVTQANKQLAVSEQDPVRHEVSSEQLESLVRLWADRPEYVAKLREAQVVSRAPRIVSAVPPKYPLIPYLYKIKAKVLVHAIIDVNGGVLEARVLESSDSRFDQAALEAVLQWRFLAGEMAGKPAVTGALIPLEFAGTR